MFVFKEGGLTTLDQLSTSMVPGSGAVSTHGWSLVEAGSLVPREGQSPDHLNMNGLHSKSRPHGMAHRSWVKEWGGAALPLSVSSHATEGPAEPRRASWMWRADGGGWKLDKPEGKGLPWFSAHSIFYFIILPCLVMSPQGLRQLLEVFMVPAGGEG